MKNVVPPVPVPPVAVSVVAVTVALPLTPAGADSVERASVLDAPDGKVLEAVADAPDAIAEEAAVVAPAPVAVEPTAPVVPEAAVPVVPETAAPEEVVAAVPVAAVSFPCDLAAPMQTAHTVTLYCYEETLLPSKVGRVTPRPAQPAL